MQQVRSLVQPHSRASYAGPFNASAASHYHVATGAADDDIDDIVSTKSYPAARATPKRSKKTLDIEVLVPLVMTICDVVFLHN